MATDATTTRSFPLFASLPTEIQRQIWHLALPGARIHRITSRRAYRPSSSSCAPPPLLSVSREARDEALRVLKPLQLPGDHTLACAIAAAASAAAGTRHCCCCFPVLMDPDVDTLFLPGRPQFALAHDPWLGRSDVAFGLVRSLAVDREWGMPRRAGVEEDIGVEEIVRRLGSVEKLHLVIECSLSDRWVGSDGGPWRPVPREGQAGCYWVPVPDWTALENMGRARYWQEEMIRKLRIEKIRSDSKGEPQWVLPEVVISFIRYEIVPASIMVPASIGYWNEDKVLGRAEPVKTDEPRPKRSIWSKFTKLFTQRLRL